MSERKDAVRALIDQARQWRAGHVRAGRQVEALACDIRIQALLDAMEALGSATGEGQ